jgi:hypothetical protein
VNLSEYARHRGVTHQAVMRAIKEGRITKEPDGSIDPVKADEEWSQNTDFSRRPDKARATVKGEAPPASNGPDYNVSRAVREAYTARLAKLEYEEKTGKLIDAEKVKTTWFNTLRIVRDRILQIPDRMTAILMAETDPLKFKTTLDAELRRILEDASSEIAKQD